MAEESAKTKTGGTEDIPFHKALLSVLKVGDENVPVWDVPGMGEHIDWWHAMILAAAVLTVAHIPEKAIPEVKEAVLKAWKEHGPGGKLLNKDVQPALRALAAKTGLELPGEEGGT